MTCELHWSIPGDDKETPLRIRPLREQWEARGPGLLGHLSKTLPWLSIPKKATVHLVKPRAGGAGRVLSPTEIEFEAVLANPWPMLPEVVRLGWLLACAGSMDTKRSIALVPPVIAAAEYVELAALDESTIECALANWFDASEQATNARDLFRWWNQFATDSSIEITSEIWQDAVAEL